MSNLKSSDTTYALCICTAIAVVTVFAVAVCKAPKPVSKTLTAEQIVNSCVDHGKFYADETAFYCGVSE